MAQASDVPLLLVAALVFSTFVADYAGAAASHMTGSVVLKSGETLYSESNKYSISIESCNLKVYKHGHQLIWQSGMADESVNIDCQLSLESNGNAVIFSGTNPLWASNTGTSMQGAHILVSQDKGILFRRDETGRVLVTTWATSIEEDPQETNIVSIEFGLPTQSALYQAPILWPNVDLLPQFSESPVHSSPQSQILFKTSPAHSSTPARHSKKTSRHYRFFRPVLSSPQVEASPVDSNPCKDESPIQNSPVLPKSSPSSFESPSTKSPGNSSPLSGTENAPLDSAPSDAGNTPQHEVSLYVLIESPEQSAPQSELRKAPALASSLQLNGYRAKGSPASEGVPVSSSTSQLTKAPVQSIPVSDVSSSSVHEAPAGELLNAPVKSAPQAHRSNSPVQSTPQSTPLSSTPSLFNQFPVRSTPQSELGSSPVQLSPLTELTNAPVHSAPQTERTNHPLQSSPRSEFSNVPEQSSSILTLSSTPVDSTPSPTFQSPVQSTPSSQSTGNSPLHSTPVSTMSSTVHSSPVDSSTQIRSTPQLNHSPLEFTPAVEFRNSPVDSTPVRSAPQSF